ncbi:hypothetical protein JB92DRAFT_3025404 [Gautieria morchelliformis]|nr:hypothetical protein JB92DRAFT_3025404 [Gautieria morchelliformis]
MIVRRRYHPTLYNVTLSSYCPVYVLLWLLVYLIPEDLRVPALDVLLCISLPLVAPVPVPSTKVPCVHGLQASSYGTKLTMLHPRTLHSWCRESILPSSLLRQDPDTMLHLRAFRAHLTHTNSFDIALFAVACS